MHGAALPASELAERLASPKCPHEALSISRAKARARPAHRCRASAEASPPRWRTQEQAMLFLNRRGYAPLTCAKPAGHKLLCPQCSSVAGGSSLSAAARLPSLRLRLAGPAIPPAQMPADRRSQPAAPASSACRRSSPCFPTPASRSRHRPIARRKRNARRMRASAGHEVDIIIGTQIVAKGHHFRSSSWSASSTPIRPEQRLYRASERTFQLLYQVAGRAGREVRAAATASCRPISPSIR